MEEKQQLLLKDLGMKFTTSNNKRKHRYGLYLCPYCNKEFETRTQHIKSGHTKSCGCLAKKISSEIIKKIATTFGLSGHKLYKTWESMKARCYNPNNKRYKDYGGRGIKVCDEWLSAKNFIEDMYPSYQEGLTLDRIDVNGNYEPDNCRWTTIITQQRNNRDIRSNNTSGFRGVSYYKILNKWKAQITVNNKRIHLGLFKTALEAAKAYETYVRQNNLEHNFTPVLTEEEIFALSYAKG